MDFVTFLLAVSLPFIYALPWDGASPTPTPTVCPTPLNPTAAAAHELLRRQNSPAVCASLVSGTITSAVICPSETCVLILSHSVLGCCDDDRDHCTYFTDCLDYYGSSVLCGSTSCSPSESTLTWFVAPPSLQSCHILASSSPVQSRRLVSYANTPSFNSSIPFCARWTHASGYSRYECAASPTVLSLATPLFAASVGTSSSTPSANSTATECPKQVSTGAIAGGVVGGIAVLVAGVIGGLYLLRRGGKKEEAVQPTVAAVPEPKHGETFPVQQGPSAPPYGTYPQQQQYPQQQPAIELS